MFFIIVSGEQTELAKAEVQAILQIKIPNAKITWIRRVGLFNADYNVIAFIIERAAYVREAGEVISEITPPSMNNDLEFGNHLADIQSFFVRAHIANSPRSSGRELSAKIGHIIKEVTGAKVTFSNPSIKVLAIDIGEKILICKSFTSQTRVRLKEKKGRYRAYFHPSLMNAPLARSMCNLAQVMPGKIMFDPFCGGGGILCEGLQIGAKCIGVDINWRLLRGAAMNLFETKSRGWSLIQGDSRCLPIAYADYIVTDPPYGRVSSTHGEYANRLVESLLNDAERILVKGGKMCICSDKKMKIDTIVQEKGYCSDVNISVRVHKCLTREIRVITF